MARAEMGLHDYQEMIVQITTHEGLCELLKDNGEGVKVALAFMLIPAVSISHAYSDGAFRFWSLDLLSFFLGILMVLCAKVVSQILNNSKLEKQKHSDLWKKLGAVEDLDLFFDSDKEYFTRINHGGDDIYFDPFCSQCWDDEKNEPVFLTQKELHKIYYDGPPLSDQLRIDMFLDGVQEPQTYRVWRFGSLKQHAKAVMEGRYLDYQLFWDHIGEDYRKRHTFDSLDDRAEHRG